MPLTKMPVNPACDDSTNCEQLGNLLIFRFAGDVHPAFRPRLGPVTLPVHSTGVRLLEMIVELAPPSVRMP